MFLCISIKRTIIFLEKVDIYNGSDTRNDSLENDFISSLLSSLSLYVFTIQNKGL